jgi:hypothetical protein
VSRRKPLVLIYLVDGARADLFRRLLDEGQLPNIRREVVSGGAFRRASSCLPSTTGPAHLPFLLGCFPGTLNIPGIRWLDKAGYHARRIGLDRFRSYNGLEAPLVNRDLPAARPTIFELARRPFAIHSMVTRGLPRGHDLTQHSKLWMYLGAHLTDRWEPVDRRAHAKLMRSLEADPDYIFAVFTSVDSYSHLRGPFAPETLAGYRYVDWSVGQVVARLKRQGRWDDTLLILTSDHGMSSTHRHLDLARFLDRRGIRTLAYPIVWRHRPQASVMISGNAVGQVYLLEDRPRGGRPVARDRRLRHPLTGARVRDALGPIWDELLAREEIDFLAWRGGNGGDGAARVYEIASARGQATIRGTPSGMTYHPRGGDPLGLGAIPAPLDERASLAASFDAEYPDALVQCDQLFANPRSGDLLVVSRPGYDLREAFEWPEHHGSHGSLHRDHMIVPVIHNRGAWAPGPMRTTDLFATTLAWLGLPPVEGIDGRALL